ncbi:sulfate ABC transporter substrate-binding protein [Phycicoccus jejuensis]|uniref:sulfate ABC transporter substrate-binding protein n=1 Tax=Phycicoccus jejuensis TaxID=367299 RepID=UPI00384E83BC
MTSRRTALAAFLTGATLMVGACAGGGASDNVDAAAGGGAAGATTTLNLYGYAVPKVGYDLVIPAFQKTEAGKGVQFQQSYGASGDQSRKVAAGAEADIVSFSVEPDVTRLVDAKMVDPGWSSGEHRGIPFGSVVTIVVRKGNPKGIKDWDDLLKPGVEVVTPNPFSSGSAKWNLLAPYAVKSQGGQDVQAGLDYVNALVSDHVKVQPKSGREATETFLQGSGDALLSYENEALFIEREGDPVEHVTPPQTFKIENPVAVLSTSKNAAKAKAFDEFLYTPQAQKLWAQAGFRPVDETVAAEFATDFPAPEKLWTIADLGGWSTVDPALFDKEKGSVAKIYNAATQ